MGLSNTTSSIRGVSGKETLTNFDRVQAATLQGNNARVGTATDNITMNASGAVTFTGAGGLTYGEIYGYNTNNTVTVTASGIANKVQIDSFDTNGLARGTTPDQSQNHITINTPGYYKTTITLAAESGSGGGMLAGFGAFKNNGASQLQNLHIHRTLSGGGGDVGSVSMHGVCKYQASDTVEVWLWNEDNATDIIIDDITLSVVQIGGVQ
jgi:hypothetical protein